MSGPTFPEPVAVLAVVPLGDSLKIIGRGRNPGVPAGRSSVEAHSVGPMLHGANSSSPTPWISLLVFLPLATARISSKICRPTSSTGVP